MEGANPPTFELKTDEIVITVKFREAGVPMQAQHLLRPPLFEDWLKYEQALQITHERDGEMERWADQRAEAAETLWDLLASRAEGYGELPEDWKAAVPAAHKEAAVRSICDVTVSENGGEAPQAVTWTEHAVCLSAVRGQASHERLLHRFRRPLARDVSRWRRVHAAMFTGRDERNQNIERSMAPSRLKDQIAFYDEFILAVEGYSLGGNAALSRDDILRSMDAWHKRIAATELFNQ